MTPDEAAQLINPNWGDRTILPISLREVVACFDSLKNTIQSDYLFLEFLPRVAAMAVEYEKLRISRERCLLEKSHRLRQLPGTIMP